MPNKIIYGKLFKWEKCIILCMWHKDPFKFYFYFKSLQKLQLSETITNLRCFRVLEMVFYQLTAFLSMFFYQRKIYSFVKGTCFWKLIMRAMMTLRMRSRLQEEKRKTMWREQERERKISSFRRENASLKYENIGKVRGCLQTIPFKLLSCNMFDINVSFCFQNAKNFFLKKKKKEIILIIQLFLFGK